MDNHGVRASPGVAAAATATSNFDGPILDELTKLR